MQTCNTFSGECIMSGTRKQKIRLPFINYQQYVYIPFSFTQYLTKALWCSVQLSISKCNIKNGYTMYLLEYNEISCSVNRFITLRLVVSIKIKIKSMKNARNLNRQFQLRLKLFFLIKLVKSSCTASSICSIHDYLKSWICEGNCHSCFKLALHYICIHYSMTVLPSFTQSAM